MQYIYIYAVTSIWFTLCINIILALSGYFFFLNNKDKHINLDIDYPKISILIPAHNEGKVIRKTAESMISLNYPSYEVIFINDNSDDNTGEILSFFERKHVNLRVITTNSKNGGRGKSNALNIGLKYCSEDTKYICVYDADNTPEPLALKYLMSGMGEGVGAVIGKYCIQNKHKNLLTRFVSIETLSYQRLIQCGKYRFSHSCAIPGTNFLIRRELIEKIGWSPDALAEDTDLTFEIYKLGYKINFIPQAVSWQQCPQNCSVWLRQRKRWSKGNFYVLFKHYKYIFSNRSLFFDFIYLALNNYFFLSGILIYDIITIYRLLTMNIVFTLPSMMIWLFAYLLYIAQNSLMLVIEEKERSMSNLLLVCLSYFSYSQLWRFITIRSMLSYIKDRLYNREVTWYKTKRF